MLLLAISVALAFAPHATKPRELELSSDDRFALLSSVGSTVGGKFIVTGLARAEGTCAVTGTCVTGENVAHSTGGATTVGPVRSVADLVENARVHGKPVVAVVSFRAARREARGDLRLIASVYEPANGRWTDLTAMLGRGTPLPRLGASPKVRLAR